MKLIPIVIALFFLAFDSLAKCPIDDKLIDCLKFQIEYHRLPTDSDKVYDPLSYCDFSAYKKKGVLNDEQVEELITYAQTHGNPILFKALDETDIPKPNQYSLNFLWINKNKLTELGHLIGLNDNLLLEKIIDPLKDWQSKQPEADINIWYDANMLADEKEAVLKTKKELDKNKIDTSKISFRNLREIQLVKENPWLFDEKRPIYFRVDLAKALIADHVMHDDKLPYVVTIDSDIAGIVRQQLFDKKTMEQLQELGYSMGKDSSMGHENSFIILYENNILETMKWHKKLIIDQVIENIENGREIDKNFNPTSQLVYGYYAVESPNFMREMQKKFFTRMSYDDDQKIDYLIKKMLNKNMIFPPSQFGSGYGYKPDQIKKLQEALVGKDGC